MSITNNGILSFMIFCLLSITNLSYGINSTANGTPTVLSKNVTTGTNIRIPVSPKVIVEPPKNAPVFVNKENEHGEISIHPNPSTVNPDTDPPVSFSSTSEQPTSSTVPSSSSPSSSSSPNSTTNITPHTVTTSSSPPANNLTTTIITSTAPSSVPQQNRQFDGASFIGGIILTTGLMGISFVAFKFYKARTERNYHTL